MLSHFTEETKRKFEEQFKCIQADCDGHGNIPVQVDDGNGGFDWEAQQCQFHAEYLFPMWNFIETSLRDTALAMSRETEVEKHSEENLAGMAQIDLTYERRRAFNSALSAKQAKEQEWVNN